MSTVIASSDLQFVFSRTGKDLLTPAEERSLAARLWRSRRRLAFILKHRKPASMPARDHRKPLSAGTRRRLLAAEAAAKACLRSLSTTGPLGASLARELAAIEEARETLLRRNVRLIAWIAKRFERKGLELEDLFQEGAIALLWSIDRFDPAREVRLSTFASHAIRLGIIRALADRGRTIRIPSYRLSESIEAAVARSRFRDRMGREPGPEELAPESGLPKESLDDLLPALRPVMSLDAPRPGTTRPLGHDLVDPRGLTPMEVAARSEARALTEGALARLPARDRRIVSMRFGLDDGEESSYEDIGRSVGLSRERTRQIEAAARERLRRILSERRPLFIAEGRVGPLSGESRSAP